MTISIFSDVIKNFFNKVMGKVTEKINDKEGEQVFLHKKYMRPDFSATMEWGSISVNGRRVAADVVSMDSSVPLKSRGAMGSASGDVPKLGMKKAMNEKMLQALKMLKAKGGRSKEIATKLFSDAVDGVKGVHERLDIMFLQALSTGVMSIDDSNNTGTGVRVDFGIPSDNQMKAVKKWSDAAATPIDDLEKIKLESRKTGNSPRYMFLDTLTFNRFKDNKQVLEAFAGLKRVDSKNIFRLSKSDIMEFVLEEYGLNIVVIDKLPTIEKDGKIKTIEAWKSGNVVFTNTLDLGTITYSELAEVDHKVEGVEYQVVDKFILVSMYRKNDPLREVTSVQALALPVLNDVSSLYILKTEY